MDKLTLAVSALSAVIAVVAARYARVQASMSQDSAAAAVKSADAASDQAGSAREQVTLSQKQLDLAEQVRREQNEPYVVVDIQPSQNTTGILVLVIENIGPTVARNVRISFTPDLVSSELQLGDRETGSLMGFRMFTHGIPMMPPGRRLEVMFDFAPRRVAKGLPNFFRATVDAEGPGGRPVEQLIYEIDLAVLYGWGQGQALSSRPDIKALKAIADNTQRISREISRIQPFERPSATEQ